MSNDPVAENKEEKERLAALRRYGILDTAPESAYDDLTQLACSICNTPVALVTLVDEQRQWFKSRVGFDLEQTERAIAFCSVAIENDDVLVVPDATEDERFRDNPLVTGPSSIGFYAGAPLVTPDGYRIGTVCVIDNKPRKLTANQLEALRSLSRQVVANLELRRALQLAATARDSLAKEMEHSAIAEASRRLADSFMHATLDSLADNIAIVNQSGEIVLVNESWSRFAEANCSPGVISGTGEGANYLEVCDKAARTRCEEAAQIAVAIRDILAEKSNKNFQLEYPCHAPHEKRWFVVQVSAFGKGQDRHVVVSHRNVTARKLADEQVRALNESLEYRVSEQRLMLQRAEQMAQIGSWQYELAGRVVTCSDGLQTIAGRRAASQEVELAELLTFVVREDQQLLKSSIQLVADQHVPRRIQCRVQRPDGTVRLVQTSIDIVRDAHGEVYGVIGACLDITDINRTVEQLRESENRLRAFGQKLEQIREDERISISREIHDELGQMLTALKIDLTLLSRDIANPVDTAPEPDVIVSALKSMEGLVDSTINSVRVIATQLRPEVLDAFGLIPAIQWHAAQFERRTEITCEVDAPDIAPTLPAEFRIALFRITQEAMTNVARHAGASRVSISIAFVDHSIVLSIADDGDGFDVRKLATATSLGVTGMRERATMIGGTFNINGQPGRGTRIEVRVPRPARTDVNTQRSASA